MMHNIVSLLKRHRSKCNMQDPTFLDAFAMSIQFKPQFFLTAWKCSNTLNQKKGVTRAPSSSALSQAL
jgi:hypothetical protein